MPNPSLFNLKMDPLLLFRRNTAPAIFLCFFCNQVTADYEPQLIETSQVWESTVADYNHDGHDDILINGHDANDRIWYWTATGYVPSPQVFPSVDRHGCDAADVNQDGLLDLYCEIGAEKGMGHKVNELWIQQTNGLMQLQVGGFGAEDYYGRGRRPQFFDFNHDTYPDLYVTNWAIPRIDGMPNVNFSYINYFKTTSKPGFVAVSTLATGKMGSLCVDKGDINHDGWDDLVVCDKEGDGHLFINTQHNDFQDSATTIYKGSRLWRDAKLVDVNLDGWDDLVILTVANVLEIRLNRKQGRLFGKVDFYDSLPFKAVSVVAGDFNRDKRPHKDLYVVLQDDACPTSGHDLAPDVLYTALKGTWIKHQLTQDLPGCGQLADVVDGNNVLLMNGGISWVGPNYLIHK
jgi:hypothetical protein